MRIAFELGAISQGVRLNLLKKIYKEQRAEDAARLKAKREAALKKRREAAKVKRAAKKEAAEATILAANPPYATFKIKSGDVSVDDPEVYAITEAIQGTEVLIRITLPPNSRGEVMASRFPDLSTRTSRKHERVRTAYTYAAGSDEDGNCFQGIKEYDAKGIWGFQSWPKNSIITVQLFKLYEPLSKVIMAQSFLDGPRHCVISPLIDYYQKQLDNATSKEFISRTGRRIRLLQRLAVKYAAGVPEGDAMEEVAKAAGRKIIIQDALSQTFQIYHKNCSLSIGFTNTRKNHLEVGNLCLTSDPEIISKERLAELIAEHRAQNQFYMFEGEPSDIRCLRSIRGAWRVANPLHDIYNRHNEANKMGHFGLDAAKHPELNRWLRSAVIINSVPMTINPDAVPTRHHDLRAAYTQHEMAGPYYHGFMGVIHQWRRLSVCANQAHRFIKSFPVALYKFRVVANPVPLFQTLGLNGTHVLPGPELLFFMDHGVRVKLLAGVFGSRTDISYSDEIMEVDVPKEERQKIYATWAGCLSHDKPTKELNFSGDREWAEHLHAIHGDAIKFNGASTHITALIPKKTYRTRHHILAFITSYTRINMLTQMMKLRPGSIQRVVLDGIFHNDEAAEFPAEFRPKKLKEARSASHLGWYPEHEESDDCMGEFDFRKLRNCVLAGAGGTGKTHSILTDKGFNDVMYVVPQHLLGQGMRGNYGASYQTIHKMIGVECSPYCDAHAPPPVILLDEATMVEGEWIDRLFTLYPSSLILVAGDIERRPDGTMMAFQCRGGKPGAFFNLWQAKQVAEHNWIRYETDYRAQDEELKQMKRDIRDWMRKNITDGGVDDATALAEWVYQRWGALTYSAAVKAFRHGDTWIAGTHRINRRLLRDGIVSGYLAKDGRKSQTDEEGWEKRGSFTTHSYQGQTVRDGRIFISIGDAFEIAMIYTAVSRAVSINQIMLVD